MKKAYLAIALVVTVVGTANAEDKVTYKTDVKAELKSDGTVKTGSSEVATDSAGTKVTSKLNETSKVNKDGTKTTTSDLVSSKDPKGLGNKTVAERQIKTTDDARGSFDRKVDSASVDSDGTAHSKSVERRVQQNSDGTAKSTFKDKVVNDPKGMMNRSVEESERTVRRDANGNVIDADIEKNIDNKMTK